MRGRADAPGRGRGDAWSVTEPIIAAVDPRHQDVAPAALGAMFARHLGAPLVLATAYTVDLSTSNLHPAHAPARGRRAERAIERVAALLDDAGISVTTTAVADGRSPARALQALAERERAQLLVIGSSRR